ncbi:MAG: integration host factor subunit beta [Planctomycetes bacterium]|nr:integration host factor subunit beta [Planctomycetota bacterium]
MRTVTKKELIDRIAERTGSKRVVVKKVVQEFLDQIISELGEGNRLEFRDFGVFESKARAARTAQNPKTLEPVHVPEKRTVKFKVGRLMKLEMQKPSGGITGRSEQTEVAAFENDHQPQITPFGG